jgi:hypothetical protein
VSGNHLFIVLTNSKPGLDDELNRWYDEEHLGSVVDSMPGAVGARRYALADLPGRPSHPYRYVAVYEVAEERLGDAYEHWMNNRRQRAGTGIELVIPMDTDTMAAGFFSPTGPVIRRDQPPGQNGLGSESST